MKIKISLLIPVLLIFSIFISKALGCTVATHEFKPYGIFSARSLDVCIDIESQFTVYPRGVKFSGAMSNEIENTVSWQSKYGFVIIEESNVHNLGTEGLNEKGLGVHLLYNGDESATKLDPKKPTINSLRWIYYLLSNFNTVNQALESLKNYNLQNFSIKIGDKSIKLPIHYKIEDSSGDSAIIEFTDGKVSVYHDKAYTVMANEPDYNEQIANLMKLSADGNKYSIDNLPGGASSLNRFARTFYATTILPDTVKSQQDAVGDIYSVINAASVPYNNLKCSLLDASAPPQDTWPTVWISAADLNARILYYSNIKIGNRVWVDLNKVNLNEDQKPKSIDLENAQLVGDLSSQF